MSCKIVFGISYCRILIHIYFHLLYIYIWGGYDQVGFDINDLKVGLHLFVISEYQNAPALLLLENVEHSSGTCRREIVLWLIFPRTEQYKTIHVELTIMNTGVIRNTKSTLWRESPI